MVAAWPGAQPGSRGAEEFVEVSWDELIELLASSCAVRRPLRNEAIYGSSGLPPDGSTRAASQVHRFLNMAPSRALQLQRRRVRK